MLQVSVSDQYTFGHCSFKYENSSEINENQKSILQRIKKSNYENTASRALNFVKQNPSIIGSALIPTERELVTLIAYECAASTIAVPVCLVPGGGAAVGGSLLGGVLVSWYGIVTIDKLSQIKETPFYQNWKVVRKRILKDENVKQYILQDDQLRFFTCKLSGKLPLIAVKIKGYEEVYDSQELQNWIAQNPNANFPLTNQKLALNDLVFDFPHMQSMMERLENLRIKTIKAIDPEAYTYNEIIINTLGNQGVNQIVMGYIGIDQRVQIDADGSYRIIAQRRAHPVLHHLFNQTKVYLNWITEKKRELQLAFRSEVSQLALAQSLNPSKTLSDICGACRDLNKRKVLWYYRNNTPVYAKPTPEEPLPWGKIVPAAILLSPVLIVVLAGAAGYIVGEEQAIQRSKALKIVDLSEKLDERISEYENT